MKIVVPKEISHLEKRVALTPDVAKKLITLGFSVCVESNAGLEANFSDDAYRNVGVDIEIDTHKVWQQADIVLKIHAPKMNEKIHQHEVRLMPAGSLLISFIWPAQNLDLLGRLSNQGISVMAMDCVPRISRSQKLDALSSMANIAGYRAVIEATNHFGRFFSGQITAAGKVSPAKVMVIGAGVAGLSAIGTAKSLGAIVRAFDTRPEVKDQILSMDAEYLELNFEEDGSGEGGYAKEMSKEFIDAEMALFAEQAKDVDIIITTALIPGKPAPILITEDMVKSMKQGSVIVDLAAIQGGNCALTETHNVVEKYGVTVIGHADLPGRLPAQASQLYAMNLYHLLTELTPEKNGDIIIDMDDDVIRGTTVVKEGKVTWPPPVIEVTLRKPAYSEPPKTVENNELVKEESKLNKIIKSLMPSFIGMFVLFAVGSVAPASFMQLFVVFVLSCFIGYMVIWNVSPSLHTPLMSVTNAISSIIIVGAILQISSGDFIISLISGIAILIATINIVGGFAVTQRMLKMFGE